MLSATQSESKSPWLYWTMREWGTVKISELCFYAALSEAQQPYREPETLGSSVVSGKEPNPVGLKARDNPAWPRKSSLVQIQPPILL